MAVQYNLSMPSYTIVFGREFDETLSDLVKTTDATTKADVIRRAVASYSFLKTQQRDNRDAKIIIMGNGGFRKEIELP